jgi:2-phospho-L-lactate guanylyltransferase
MARALHAIVPIKRFALAKQRLSSVATLAERAELACAMADNLLEELTASRVVNGCTVVTAESTIAERARGFGFTVLTDPPAWGLNAAVGAGLAMLPPKVDSVVVHADLPLFRAAEFDDVARLHLSGIGQRMTLVTDRRGDGTNLRFLSGGAAIPPLYGPASAWRHRDAAFAESVPWIAVRSQPLSLDCDTPSDIAMILAAGGDRLASRMRHLLAAIAERRHCHDLPLSHPLCL